VNRDVAQPPRLARINACARAKQVDARGVLASNTVTVFGPSAGGPSEGESSRANYSVCISFPCKYTLRQASEHGDTVEIADVFLPAPPRDGSVLRIEMWTDLNQGLGRSENVQLKALMEGRLQEGSALAGFNGAILGLYWSGEAVDVQVMLRVDSRTVRRQAGCRTVVFQEKSESWDGRLELCLGGKVALHTFSMQSRMWSSATEYITNLSEVLTANITDWSANGQGNGEVVTGNPTFVTAVVSLRCCNGRSCGDAVCPSAAAAAEALQAAESAEGKPESRVKLGGGVAIRMPLIQPSQRPSFDTVSRLQEYVTKAGSGTQDAAHSQLYLTASNWTQLCPTFPTPNSFAVTATQNQACPTALTTTTMDKNREWPPARYAHAMQTSLRHSTVLIYGGVGCARYAEDAVKGFCLTTEVLEDLWEFDASKQTFRKIYFNDKLAPSFGHLLVKIPEGGVGGGRGSADILVIGGSKSFYSYEPLWGKPRPRTVKTTVLPITPSSKTTSITVSKAPDTGHFVLRHLHLLENRSTAEVFSPAQVGGLWGGTVVTNSTHAFIFGGFEVNALSSAVYIYNLREPHQTDGQVSRIKKIVSAAPRPSASAFSAVHRVNSTFAVWTGGVVRGPFSNSLMSRSDIWALSTTGTEFGIGARVPQFYAPSNLPASYPLFSASFAFEVDGFVLLVSHGGLVGRYSLSQNASAHIYTHADSPMDLHGFRVFLLARADGSSSGWEYKIIDGKPCPLDQVAVVSNACVRGAPDFNEEGWVCANAGSSSEAYCSYDVGLSACARCKDTGGTAGGISAGIRGMTLICPDTHIHYCTKGTKEDNAGDQYLSHAKDSQHDASHCAPAARFMQSLTRGTFLGGDSAVMYGGLDRNGSALSDLWLLNLAEAHPGHSIDLEWRGSNSSRFNASDYLSSIAGCEWIDAHISHLKFFDVYQSGGGLITYQCLTCGKDTLGDNNRRDANTIGRRLTFIVKSTKVQCVNPGKAKAWADRQKLQLDMDMDIAFAWTARKLPDTLTVPMWQYAQPVGSKQSDSSNPCSVHGTLPGPRHGHVAVAIKLQQLQNSALLIYGGESTDLDATHPQLSSDLHMAVFGTNEISVTQPTLVDDVGQPCNSGGNCPEARRDAASLLIEAARGHTGRLFVFGGLTHKHGDSLRSSTFSSPLRAYLDGDILMIKALDDLWYLDLSDLTYACSGARTRGMCPGTILTWNRVLVSAPYFAAENGGHTLKRWGATMIMDPSAEALVLVGGASIENASASNGGDNSGRRDFGMGQSIVEHADAFTLSLRQASCCRVQEAPTRTQTGAFTSFKVRCTDALGYPASTASVSAKFSGPKDLECLCESTLSSPEESGLYVCRVSALVAGLYRVFVFVAESKSSSEHNTQLAPFSVNVEASSASWPMSEVRTARSQDLRATAGEMADFSIVAKDRYGNLARETGVPIDFMLVLHLADSASFPDGSRRSTDRVEEGDRVEEDAIVGSAAAALDAGSLLNWFMDSEGMYRVNYWVTRSGTYSIHAVSPSGYAPHSIVGPSPGVLSVTSCSAVIENSYVFGQVANAVSGQPSSLYVQMRDRFGNRVDFSEATPYEDVQVNLCLKIGGIQGQTCGGIEGFQNNDITVLTEHVNELDSKDFSGVYKLTLNFFNDGNFILLVLHNKTILNCYFDFPRNPGHLLADMCTKQTTIVPTRLTAVLGAKFTADGEEITAKPVPGGAKNENRRLEDANGTRRQSGAAAWALEVLDVDPAASRSPSRSSNLGGAYTLKLYTLTNISMSVEPVFAPQNLGGMVLLFYLPLGAACVALLLQGVCYVCSAVRERNYREVLEDFDSARPTKPTGSRHEGGSFDSITSTKRTPAPSTVKRNKGQDNEQGTFYGARPGRKPTELPTPFKGSLNQSDPAAGVVPRGSGISEMTQSQSGAWTPPQPSRGENDAAAGSVTKQEVADALRARGLPCSKRDVERIFERVDINGDGTIDEAEFRKFDIERVRHGRDGNARKSVRVSPSQKSPSQRGTSPALQKGNPPDAYPEPSEVDQYLSRALSPEAIRTLQNIKGVSLRAPAAIVATTTPGSRLLKTYETPLHANRIKTDVRVKPDDSNEAQQAATSLHLVRAQRIGDSQDAAGAHAAGQDADIRSEAGVANARAEVDGNNPKAMSPKRKNSPQWCGVVFKPDILRTPPSPSSSPRRTLPTSPRRTLPSSSESTLLDIDSGLDYVTLLENGKVIYQTNP
jgi:hypothetical protein